MFEWTIELADSDYEAEVDQPEEDPDGISEKSPVGLFNVSRSLSRRWQALSETNVEPPIADDHYLSALSRLAEQSLAAEQGLDLTLLAEIGRLVTKNIRAHLRATHRAQRQLRRELIGLAESMGREDLAEAVDCRARTD